MALEDRRIAVERQIEVTNQEIQDKNREDIDLDAERISVTKQLRLTQETFSNLYFIVLNNSLLRKKEIPAQIKALDVEIEQITSKIQIRTAELLPIRNTIQDTMKRNSGGSQDIFNDNYDKLMKTYRPTYADRSSVKNNMMQRDSNVKNTKPYCSLI